ncbi:MAG: hypothetical protein HKN36_00645 [Hellea sp.]|nr:hypothetical protein [Hellea sp.]
MIFRRSLMLGLSILVASCSEGQDQSRATEQWSGDPPVASASLADKASYLATQSSPAAQFELGVVETMRAIETVYRYRYDHFSGQLPLTPGGRHRLPTNPDAEFDPAFIDNAMRDGLVHLKRATNALENASGKDFAVVLNVDDFWFDIDQDGKQGENEALMQYLPGILGNPNSMRWREVPEIGEIRFDTADADWLLAYAHTLSGMAEIVLAMDTAPAIKQITDGREALLDGRDPSNMFGFDEEVDSFAAFIMIMRGAPKAEHSRRAHKHFLAMVDANQDFWKRLEEEDDDDREWIPNSRQSSALGPQVPPELAESWQHVLGDIRDLLEGRKLVPYWRIEQAEDGGAEYGLNLKAIFMDPPDTDIILLIQGASLAPYLEKGELVDRDAWREFSRLTGRQTGMFALWFN